MVVVLRTEFLGVRKAAKEMREACDKLIPMMQDRCKKLGITSPVAALAATRSEIRALPLPGDEPDYCGDEVRDHYLAEGGDPA